MNSPIKPIGFCVTLLLLNACASQPVNLQTPGQKAETKTPQTVFSQSQPLPPKLTPQMRTSGQLTLSGGQVQMQLQLPPLPQPEGFQTKALDLSRAKTIKATLTNLDPNFVYVPQGANSAGELPYPADGVLNLTFKSILKTHTRLIARIKVFDENNQFISGSAISSVFDNRENTLANINFRTTPTALILENMLNSNAFLAKSIPLEEVQNLVDTIIAVDGSGKATTYLTSPELVDTRQLANDILQRNSAKLDVSNNYVKVGGTLNLTVSGLVELDTVNLRPSVASLPNIEGLGNGSLNFAGIGEGTNFNLTTSDGNEKGTTYTYTVSPTPFAIVENGTTNLTITATPATPVLTSLNPSTSGLGGTVTLNGSDFHKSVLGNQVTIGGQIAQVDAVSVDRKQLTVKVPDGLAIGNQNVQVSVGSVSSAVMALNIANPPAITGLNLSTGKSGDKVVISGSGFNGATAVKFNGSDAFAYTVDNNTQITAQVPFGNVTTGKISVVTPAGTALSVGNYTISPSSKIWLVKANAVGTGSSNNWNNAFPSLQTALANASANDEIWVAAGTYKPGPARANTFTLKSNVPVYGGFAGTEVIRTARDFTNNISILDGDVSGNDNPVVTTGDANRNENNERVVTSTTANTTIDGFTIQGGNTLGLSSDGGGFNIANGTSSTISNMIFRANTAINGGGLFINAGNPTVTNVTFINNATTSSGAGLFNMGSANPTLNNVKFSGNTCGNGGGLYVNSGTVTVNNGVFSSNTATGPLGGGGMYVSNGGANAVLNKVVFSGNTAPNGGGVYTFTSNPTLTNVIFTGNTATNQGGGFFNNSNGNPKLVNVTFNSNTATSGGSAFYNSTGSPGFVNVLLWNNVFGNIALPGSQGNFTAGANPFTAIADPDGADNVWFTADDGLQLAAGDPALNQGIASFAGFTLPTTDITTLVSRPQNGSFDPGAYEKLPAPLSLTGFSPSNGKSGDQITITGAGFTGTNSVKINGVEVPEFTVDSANQITARVPFGKVASGLVSVSTPTGNVLSAGNFTVNSRIYLVKANAVGNGSGNNWSNAYPSLQTALAQALANDQIWVAAGVYKPVVPINPASVSLSERGVSFVLKPSVAVYGGFAGTEMTLTARNFDTQISELSGDIDNVTDVYDTTISDGLTHTGIAGNSFNIVKGANLAILDGFTLRGGNANGVGPDQDRGGAVLTAHQALTLNNLIFIGNTANSGGALNSVGNGLIGNNLTFKWNKAYYGGGMVTAGNPSLNKAVFIENEGSSGGALYMNYATSLQFKNMVFSRNKANAGGALHNSSAVTISNAVFYDNKAKLSGPGIYNMSGNIRLVNATFTDEIGTVGTSIVVNSGTPRLTNVLFVNDPSIPANLATSGNNANSGNIYHTYPRAQTSIDPFINRALPAGPDGIWLTADDGLRLKSTATSILDKGVSAISGVTIPTTDILGANRIGLPEPGAYEGGF
jgi:hypothetical protein